MAVVIVATPGASDANSYCSLAEANTYHEGHPYSSTWDDASDDQKNRALVTATRLLDERYEWVSWATNTAQALQWPRSGVMDHLQLSEIDSDVIPPKLKEATAELARQLLDSDRMADNQVEAQGISSMSAGAVSFSFKDTITPKVLPDAVRNMIPSWWGRFRGSGAWRPVGRS